MTPPTYEAYRRNPKLIQPLLERAHRERREEVNRLIVVPIKALLGRLFARRAPKAGPSLGTPVCA